MGRLPVPEIWTCYIVHDHRVNVPRDLCGRLLHQRGMYIAFITLYPHANLDQDWYTRTIDISHDHFGFMLAWGDTTFLPCLYTLQVQYLARYPTYLTRSQSIGLLVIGLTGYAIFRSANFQRDYVRARNGNCKLWGKQVTYIPVKYTTSDGKEHNSLLLTSGWWGVSRHANYLADLMQAWAMCATCGFTHFLPWSYFFFMTILLCHRSLRDEKRCHNKYGKHWEEYCKQVPYRILPGVF